MPHIPIHLQAHASLMTAVGLALACGPVLAQSDSSRMLSPSGYTGAINTPSAHVLPWGSANLAWTNNNPELARKYSQGSFGSLNAGAGLLPGLEAVGRLSYDGDLNCNMYAPPCPARTRDLSVSAKYQLPLSLWQGTRLAVGVSDFGGAATQYRQVYGVATTPWRDAEISLGYSRAHSAQSLMQGAFGSVRYALNPQWSLLAEHDTRENRAGLQYQRPVGERSQLVAGYSRKWTNQSDQAAHQLQLAWVFHMDRSTPRPAPIQAAAATQPHIQSHNQHQAQQAAAPTASAPALPTPQAAPHKPPESATASDLAQQLKERGFAHIEVKHWPQRAKQNGIWHITAESRTYRQSQIEALGHALRPWLELVRQQRIQANDQIHLTLTYQREPVLQAQGQAACLSQWAQGEACAASAEPLTIGRAAFGAAALPTALGPAEQTAQASAGSTWAPQLTISPALRNAVGTEYGLVDYSLAAQVGAEVGLAPGLFWQGIYLIPLSNSDDYQAGRVFGDSRFAKRQWHSQQLTYWKSLPLGIQAQVSAGQLAPMQTGSQFDALWMSAQGRWLVGGTSARYRHEQSNRDQLARYAQVRYSIIPGAWHAEVMGGQFMQGDTGYKLSSVHWAGDTRFALHYQNTGSSIRTSMPNRKFMGFTASFPMGPKAATPLGPVWLRAQDRWQWGLQSKVGEKDNYLTSGYGEYPRQRHGLWSDVTDHDRNGSADLQAQLPRLRALLQAPGR